MFDWTQWLTNEKLEDHVDKDILISGASEVRDFSNKYNIKVHYTVTIEVNEKED